MTTPLYAALCGLAVGATVVCSAGGALAEPSARSSYASGRPLEWLWMNGEAGYAAANLRTFTANTETLAVGLVPTAGTGPTAGFGAGVRIVFVTLGLRGRVASLTGDTPTRGSKAWQLWTLAAEVGIRVPLRRIEPYFTLGLGYASIGGFADAVDGLKGGLAVSGASARIGVGVDYYVTPAFSLGVNCTGDALMLARKGVSLASLAEAKRVGSIDEVQARILETSGSSVGTLVAVTGVAGLHF